MVHVVQEPIVLFSLTNGFVNAQVCEINFVLMKEALYV